jgi:rhodanese-related sulfurtransferase
MINKIFYRIVLAVIIIGIFLPPLIIGIPMLSAPSITPQKAVQLMKSGRDEILLVDVRSDAEHMTFSLKNSVNVPMVNDNFDRQTLDAVFKGKKQILVICNVGISGAKATNTLIKMGYQNVLNVEGGLDGWISSELAPAEKRVNTLHGEDNGAPFLALNLFEQLIITSAVFFIKPLYLTLSLIIVIMLWKRSEKYYIALKWAVISFYAGEMACAFNFLLFEDQSMLMEYFHSYGMIVFIGLLVYALFDIFDRHVINYSGHEQKCILLPLCKRCYKYDDAACNIWLLFLFIIPASIIIASIPLTASTGSYFHLGYVFDTPVVFGHPVMYQLIETSFSPAAAIVFLSLSCIPLILLREKGFEFSKVLFAMGIGPLGFSLMRFFLCWSFERNPVWADAWEEITELIIILILFLIIWRIRTIEKKSICHSEVNS